MQVAETRVHMIGQGETPCLDRLTFTAQSLESQGRHSQCGA